MPDFVINSDGYIEGIIHHNSPYFNLRPHNEISLLVIHNISLPPRVFGENFVDDLFMGRLDPDAHPYFRGIYQLEVSAHCFIRRTGEIIQYVPFLKRAWHAGKSEFQGRCACNDFSVGIELEGADDIPYTSHQYDTLASITRSLMQSYPDITENRITGHSSIAPDRKTDPGEAFDWERFRSMLKNPG